MLSWVEHEKFYNLGARYKNSKCSKNHKTLVRIANRADPDPTASSEAVWSGSALFLYAFFLADD